MDSSVYSSFNFYGQPGVGRRGATPSVTSLVGSQQVSSTMWQLFGLTPSHSIQTLTAEQSSEIFLLAVECQALDTNLAKQFLTISGLKVIHQAATQATAYETISMRQMAHNMAFSPPTGADVDAAMLEETKWQNRTEADKAWKATHELVYNHQLHCNGQLAAFIGMVKEPSRKNGVGSGNVSASSRSSRHPTSYPRSLSGLPMKKKQMTAVQRECLLWLTQ